MNSPEEGGSNSKNSFVSSQPQISQILQGLPSADINNAPQDELNKRSESFILALSPENILKSKNDKDVKNGINNLGTDLDEQNIPESHNFCKNCIQKTCTEKVCK